MEKNKKYKECQSCAMPLKKDKEKEHEYYCSKCWKDNKFIDENLTLDQMKKINFDVMTKEFKMPKFMANMFNKKLPKLERWIKK